MHSLRSLISGSVLVLALVGCSSAQENRALDQKVSQQGDVTSSADLTHKLKSLDRHTPGLTPDKQAKLQSIQQRTRAKLDANREESLKVRALLIQDVLAAKPNQKEINAAKSRLKQLSKDRIDAIFTAADDTNEALGRNEMMREATDLQFVEDDFNFW
jgi:hypothetical protein